MKAVIFSYLYKRGEDVFVNSGVEFILCQERNEEEFLSLQQKHGAQVAVLDSRPYSEHFFKKLLPQTLIVRFGTGVDNIPKSICEEKGHLVANTPGASTTSVCEYVFTVMNSLSHGICSGSREMIRGNWVRPTGWGLRGRKLAVLGLGKIGSVVAETAKTKYGMEVVGLCRRSQILSKKKGFERNISKSYPLTDDLQEAVCEADYVTLHLSLNPETRYMINREVLSCFKPGAFFINTARGKHVRESDLRKALFEGKLGGAALDVFENEPYTGFKQDSSEVVLPHLIDFPNVILTPHIAGHTHEANVNTATMVVENISAFLTKRWEDVNWVVLSPDE